MTDEEKLQQLFIYLMRKGDRLVDDLSGQVKEMKNNPLEILDLLELAIAKDRLDFFNDIERDIVNILGKRYYIK